jgi:hypothetical protein
MASSRHAGAGHRLLPILGSSIAGSLAEDGNVISIA